MFTLASIIVIVVCEAKVDGKQLLKLNFILDIVDNVHVDIVVLPDVNEVKEIPAELGNYEGNPIVIYPPDGNAFLICIVNVYDEVALTTRDEDDKVPESRVTAVAVRVSPEFNMSTGVDVFV